MLFYYYMFFYLVIVWCITVLIRTYIIDKFVRKLIDIAYSSPNWEELSDELKVSEAFDYYVYYSWRTKEAFYKGTKLLAEYEKEQEKKDVAYLA